MSLHPASAGSAFEAISEIAVSSHHHEPLTPRTMPCVPKSKAPTGKALALRDLLRPKASELLGLAPTVEVVVGRQLPAASMGLLFGRPRELICAAAQNSSSGTHAMSRFFRHYLLLPLEIACLCSGRAGEQKPPPHAPPAGNKETSRS